MYKTYYGSYKKSYKTKRNWKKELLITILIVAGAVIIVNSYVLLVNWLIL